jgi:hypothetical protein
MNEFTKNYTAGRTNVWAANQPTPISTPHIDPFFQSIIRHDGNRPDQHQACDREFQPHPQPSSIVRGSLWAETQALWSFQDQSCQFDHRTCNILERTRTSTSELIKMTNCESQRSRQRRINLGISITVHEMAQVEATVLNEVTNASSAFSKDEKYGYAPRENLHIQSA